MPTDELPSALRQFLARYIRSVEQLDILLLLAERPDAVWTVQGAYEVILSTPVSVERWLNELSAQGLLICEPSQAPAYRFATASKEAEQVAALAQFYKTAPVRIIEAVYQPQINVAQTFADAFKIKKPDKS